MFFYIKCSPVVILDILPKTDIEEDLIVTAAVSANMDSESVNTRDTFIHLQTVSTHTSRLIISLRLSTASSDPRHRRSACPFSDHTGELWNQSSHATNPFLCSSLRLIFSHSLFSFSTFSFITCLVFFSPLSPSYNLSSSLQVKVKASSVVQASKLTVSIQPPLAVTQDQFVLEPMGECVAAFLSLACLRSCPRYRPLYCIYSLWDDHSTNCASGDLHYISKIVSHPFT